LLGGKPILAILGEDRSMQMWHEKGKAREANGMVIDQ
jgi:hypothetical protein